MSENELIEIAVLWKNKSKKGEIYLSGYLGNAILLVFKNQFKEKDNQPDYKVYVAPKKNKDKNNLTSRDDSNIPF